MKEIFTLGPGLRCNLPTLLETRLLFQANSGGGKSWGVRRVLEQTHGEVQQLVIDSEGDFPTLREKFDYVLAAESGGDTAADPRTAKLLAERLRRLGVSAILDLHDLSPDARAAFVAQFLEGLVEAPRDLWGRAALVVIDEAHLFAPQDGRAMSTKAVIDVGARGRRRGLCTVLATHRIASLHKDATAQQTNRLIGRTAQDVDVRRAAEELGWAKADQHQLRELPPGEFFAFGPALCRVVTKVAIGPVRTTHVQRGREAVAAPPPTAEIRALLPQLADLPAEAEKRTRTVEDLQRELAELRKTLATRQPAEPVAVPVLADADRELLTAASRAMADVLKRFPTNAGPPPAPVAASPRPTATPPPPPPAPPRTRFHPAVPPPRSVPPRPSNALSSPQQRILDVLAWMESHRRHVERTLLALLVGAKPASSAYRNNLGTLRALGHVDYPITGAVGLTNLGRAQARPADPPRTSAELQVRLLADLSGPQQRLVQTLIDVHPAALNRADLAARVGAATTSSAYRNNLGALRSLGLIDYPQQGRVVVTEMVFLKERAA